MVNFDSLFIFEHQSQHYSTTIYKVQCEMSFDVEKKNKEKQENKRPHSLAAQLLWSQKIFINIVATPSPPSPPISPIIQLQSYLMPWCLER